MAKANGFPKTDEIASLLKCVIGRETAAYVSVPITTGKRFLQWYREEGKKLSKTDYAEAHFKEVIQPNMDDAQEFIDSIRRSHECIVIEPTSLSIECWSQADYNGFWKTVIEQYVDKIYFGDGWYLSKGCAIEFMAAFKKGIPMFKQDKKALTAKQGAELIKSGIAAYKELGLDAGFHTKVYGELGALI